MKAAYKEPDYESIFRENEGKPLKTLIAIYQGKYVKLFWSVVFFLIKDSPSWISPLVMAAMIDIITKPDEDAVKKIIIKTKDKKDGYGFWLKFLVPLILAVWFLVVSQKDLGSALPLVAIAFLILLVSGVDTKLFAMLIGIGVLLAVCAMVVSPHRQQRLKAFFDGSDSATYHINNALIAIGSGGLFGVGIGNNVQTAGYLPESITDSMFAVIGETIGFVGILVVLFFYYMLLTRILKVADCTKDNYYQLVTIGIFAWLAGHVIVNIAAMTGLLPLTGITLPLLSKGGTSLILNMAIIGLVLNISQYTMRSDVLDMERREKQ